jgi:hypothetical protein
MKELRADKIPGMSAIKNQMLTLAISYQNPKYWARIKY